MTVLLSRSCPMHCLVGPPSKTPTLQPPRGSPSVLWSPHSCLRGGTKRLHKHLSYFCQPLLTGQRDHSLQQDGNAPRKDRADRLRSAGPDKNLCSLWVMFGFLAHKQGASRLHPLLRKHTEVWILEVQQVALTFYLEPPCWSGTACSKNKETHSHTFPWLTRVCHRS